uniref:Uncharacterized protein n=1 Tax=viral metagenome TaxID=1070528 RepID=A0A6M3LE97_9ZZZZ
MKIKLTKLIGNSTLEVESDKQDIKSALAEVLLFTQPDICGKCGSDKIEFITNKAVTDEGTFIYVKRRCLNEICKATSTMGEYKGGGQFWKAWEIYQPNADTPQTNPASQPYPPSQTQQYEPPMENNH